MNGGSVEEGDDHQQKGVMHDIFLPPSLIISFVLALLALVLNYVNPGVAALVAAIAALIFLKLLVMGR